MNGHMSRYKVTLTQTRTEIVEAENPWQAAVEAADDGVQVVDVRPAVGRPVGASSATKTVTKKPGGLDPEERRRILSKNLEKARAARARNLAKARKGK